jgi:hypothetical protein
VLLRYPARGGSLRSDILTDAAAVDPKPQPGKRLRVASPSRRSWRATFPQQSHGSCRYRPRFATSLFRLQLAATRARRHPSPTLPRLKVVAVRSLCGASSSPNCWSAGAAYSIGGMTPVTVAHHSPHSPQLRQSTLFRPPAHCGARLRRWRLDALKHVKRDAPRPMCMASSMRRRAGGGCQRQAWRTRTPRCR